MRGRERRRELDELDRRLVAALRRDGRTPNVELAKRLGVSEKTVRSRIARLVAEHGLTVTAELADPTRRSRMQYLVHTEPGARVQVAEFLATRPEVDRVHLSTGAADVLVAASFPDDATALHFQVRTIEAHPGVRSADSCHLIGEVNGPLPTSGPPGPRVDAEVLARMMISPPRHGEFGDLAETICDTVTAGLGADRVLITAVEPGTDRRTPDSHHRRAISDHYVEALRQRVEDGNTHGVIKRVWETRLHVVVEDARTDPLMATAHHLVREEGYVGLLTLPVLYGDSLVATIALYYDRLTTFDDEYVATAQGVADHFAVAIARTLGLAPTLRPAEPSAAR